MPDDFKIDQVAELARLNLKADETAKLGADLAKILDYVKQLQELKTDDIEPTSHVLKLENVFRSDELKPCDIAEHVLEHAPKREGRFFKVPKVIEG